MMQTIAALFVMADGAYANLPGVDVWDKARDARTYAGPWPVVAHPPCERWGGYWDGGPEWRKQGKPPKKLGDDEGCFAAALAAVRRWGGVLEHPARSHAWSAHGLMPPAGGGWCVADWDGGWTCVVDQGCYGHRASKPTWLYACGVDMPTLDWRHARKRLPGAETDARKRKTGVCQWLSKRHRAATPNQFRDLLISIARTAKTRESQSGVALRHEVQEQARCSAHV